MKKYFYALGASSLALSVGGLPAMPEVPAMPTQAYTTGVEGLDSADIQVGNVRIQTDEQGGRNVQVGNVQVKTDEQGRANVRVGDLEVGADEEGNVVTVGDIRFTLEDTVKTVFSPEGLKRSIEQRKQELEQEVASTTSQVQDVLENVSLMRLAVHALLASKDLLGGIGRQVSQIAQQMNDSVATTTSAEAKIQSRGFLTRLLFGGDSVAADAISQAVTKNQENVQKVAELLDQADISADIQTTLLAQMAALKAEQERLQGLAKKEKSRWGIFSWRFF